MTLMTGPANSPGLRPVVLIMLLLFVGSGGCTEGDTGPVGPEETVLQGMVVRAGTQVLLTDVPVTMDSRTARTDERGSYRFEDVPPGEVTLRVSWPGYLPYERSLLIVEGVNDFDIALLPDD